jgi:hypothetical protein
MRLVTDIFDQPDDDLVVYELGEWSLDQRAALVPVRL